MIDANQYHLERFHKKYQQGIVATMQDLYEKAEAQLEEARQTEKKSVQAYQMLAQSLKDLDGLLWGPMLE